MTRNRIFALVLLSILVYSAPAWCGTPSDVNGIGTVVEDNIGITRGMGGAGIADGGGWNMLRSNPAVSMTFRKATYGIGMLYTRSRVSTGTAGSYTTGGTDPTMIRFVLPLLGKAAVAWSLSPFTRTDTTVQMPSNAGDTFTDTMKSTGGINLSSFELSGTLKGVSAGIGYNYYFGAIEEEWLRDYHGAVDMVNSTNLLRREYSGNGMSVGILARAPGNTSVGFGYATGTTLDRTAHLRHGTSLQEIVLERGKSDIPSRWRIGVSTDLSRRLTAAADLSGASWERAARTEKEKRQYQNTYTFSAGVRYIPALNSTAAYLSTMPLSMGFRLGSLYYKSYPAVKSIPERAITLGLEFPFKEKSGSLITSYEFGKRGSRSANGWDDTFFTVGLTLVGSIK